jgi:hypothetical protein
LQRTFGLSAVDEQRASLLLGRFELGIGLCGRGARFGRLLRQIGVA